MSTTTTEADYYVSPNGYDTNPGALDAPFATLARARDAVRELKNAAGEAGLSHPITVMVRGGKYYLDRCLDLTAADSGTDKTPITYTAYPGEEPVISGGRRVTGWQPYKDKICKCEFPEAKGGAIAFRYLFADGERQTRARYPNLDPDAARWNGRWARSKPDDAALESSEPYIVWDEPDAFRGFWSKPAQGELFLMPRQTMWGDSALIRIKSIDPDKKIIRLVHGMRSFDINPFYCPKKLHHPENCQFIVENILEELDQPGEWCVDTEEGILYFWPPKGSIEEMEVVVPLVKCLIHMEGVSNLRISGFVFTETRGGEPSSHYHDVDGIGAMAPQMDWEYCGETIYMSNCVDCRIEDNRIFNVGGNGIYMRHHNERNLIRRNEISHAGANGVVLAGGKHSIYQKTGGTPGIPHPIFNEITDNRIHHIGLVDTYVAGVFPGLGNWNRVAHNEISDVPHHAINLGNSRYGRNYIEYNRITRACRVTHDNGAINCWHEMPPEIEPPGHVIRYNFISDTGNADTSGLGYSITMGIYLDNWSSNCIVYGNIVIDTLPRGYGVGILVKGHNNIIENNIVVNPGRNHISIMAHCCYPEFATVVSRNVFYDTLGGKDPFLDLAKQSPLCKVLLKCDNNLFFKKEEDNPLIAKCNPWHETGEDHPLMTEGVRFSDWPGMYGRDEDVYDVNSLVADPLFVDAANGDYRLQAESPALTLGFQPIDIAKIGVRRKGPQKRLG
ncbi:MAG: right-handed parallel beta-helix repeat-containing protein [Candidatus Latescibacterota bacterium]